MKPFSPPALQGNAIATRRQYHGGCAVAYALDQLGHRWTIPIIKELLFGGLRFSALKSRLPGIGPNVLIQRLTELEDMGLVQKRELMEPAPVNIYELTETGLGSRPLIVTLARWAAHSPRYEVLQPLSPASLMILLEAVINPEAVAGLEFCFDIKVGHDGFAAALSGEGISIDRGNSDAPAFVISGSTAAICLFVFGGIEFAQLESEGRITVSGDRELISKLPAIFHHPTSSGPVLTRQ